MKFVPPIILVVLILAVVASAQVPAANHVVLVLEENHGFGQVIGNSNMPYLNSLANKYGLAVDYYANTHPSIGNYLMLTTGQIITNSDGYTGTISANNIVRGLLTAGVSWKSYAESLPYTGYLGGDVYPYVKHHNPFAYFTDVVNSSSEKYNIVPFSHFAQDLANGTLPRFAYVVPNMHHDMHDCPTTVSGCTDAQKAAAADYWLKTNIGPLLANAQFQKNGILIITWDESYSTDTAHGGGHVATVVVSPMSKPGYRSTTFYQHQSTLRTIMTALGAGSLAPGAAATAPLMSDFFYSASTYCVPSTTLNTVTICSPAANTTVTSPVQIVAVTTSATAVNYMAVWVDGVKKLMTYTDKLNTTMSMAAGTHRLTIQAKNTAGTLFAKTIYFTVK